MSAPTEPDIPETVTYREIQEILRTFRDSGWTGMAVELHGMRITVGKHGLPASRGPATRESGFSARRVGGAATAPGVTPASAPAGDSGSPGPEGASAAPARTESAGSPASGEPPPAPAGIPAPAAGGSPAGPGPGGAVDTTGCVAVRSPAVGVFWVAPSPGQPPFVQVGHEVARDEQLAIVEVMKLMNPVVAPVAGTVVQVCAANAELVEYEQVLFWIRPSDE